MLYIVVHVHDFSIMHIVCGSVQHLHHLRRVSSSCRTSDAHDSSSASTTQLSTPMSTHLASFAAPELMPALSILKTASGICTHLQPSQLSWRNIIVSQLSTPPEVGGLVRRSSMSETCRLYIYIDQVLGTLGLLKI